MENNIWVAMDENILHPFEARACLYQTKTQKKNFNFMRKCYLNNDGYLQYRKTEGFLGYAIFWGRNISHEKCMVLLKRAGKFYLDETLNSNNFSRKMKNIIFSIR